MSNTIIYDSIAFHETELCCAKNESTGTIYVAINPLLKGMGFGDKQIKFQIDVWKNDPAIFCGLCTFSYPVRQSFEEMQGISLAVLPLALDSINLASGIFWESEGIISKRLAIYRNECVDAIANHFANASRSGGKSVSPSVSLSREEIAAYMLYEERHVDQIEKTVVAFMNNQTEIINKFIGETLKSQAKFHETALSVITTAINQMPRDVAQLKESNKNKEFSSKSWKQTMTEKIREYAAANCCCISNIYSQITRELSHRFGVNTTQLRREYAATTKIKGYVPMLEIFDGDQALQEQFEVCMNCVFERGGGNDYSYKVPAEIVQRISPYATTPATQRGLLQRIYREIESKLQISLKDHVNEYRKKTGLRVLTAYVIANTPELMDAFDEVVSELS